MTKKSVFLKIMSLSLALVFTMSCIITALPIKTEAAISGKKEQKTYEIAVAFDNSGSMYKDKNPAWCQAKYAMEIFASMLDFSNGDKLTIFPMWDVETGGSTAVYSGGSRLYNGDGIVISSKTDIDNCISKMFTPNAAGTPYKAVNDAYDYLGKTSASEKWLIVLTDGEFGSTRTEYEHPGNVLADFKKKSTDVNLQYLGFGSEALEYSEDKKYPNFHSKKADDGNAVITALIEICNLIFARDELPLNYLNGNELQLGISMNKVIVFVQGNGAKVESLSGVNKLPGAGQRKWSEKKYSAECFQGYENGGGTKAVAEDHTLYGEVVTFDACKAGEYTLNYSGVDKKNIRIFYEPDVTLDVKLVKTDPETGDKIEYTAENASEIVEGEYEVVATILDAQTNKDVTDHELMGEVTITTTVTPEGGSPKTLKPGEKVTFDADSKVDILVEGTYLEDYTIRSDDELDLSWLLGIDFPAPELDILFSAAVKDPGAYKILDWGNWAPIEVTLELDGKAPTDEEAGRIDFKVNAGGLKISEPKKISNGKYEISIVEKPAPGSYKLDFSETVYTDEYDKPHKLNSGNKSFDIGVENFTFGVNAKAEQKTYKIIESGSWKSIVAEVTINGTPLTAAQMENVIPGVKVSGDVKYSAKKEGSSIVVTLDTASIPKPGKYTFDFSGTTYNDNGTVNNVSKDYKDKAKVEVEVQSFTFTLEPEVLQDGEWYQLNKRDSWKPIRVKMYIDGKPMSKEQLEAVKLNVQCENEIAYNEEYDFDNSAILLHIGRDADGNEVDVEEGVYELDFSKTSYTDKSGDTSSASFEDEDDAVAEIEVAKYAKFWRWLKWVLIFLALFLLWLLYMLQKVLPKNIVKDKTSTLWTVSAGNLDDNGLVDIKYNAKSKTLSINVNGSFDPTEQMSATFTIKAIDNHFTPSKRRRIVITRINSTCESISIGAAEYIVANGQWVKKAAARSVENGKEAPPLEHVTSSNAKFKLVRAPGGIDNAKVEVKTKTK